MILIACCGSQVRVYTSPGNKPYKNWKYGLKVYSAPQVPKRVKSIASVQRKKMKEKTRLCGFLRCFGGYSLGLFHGVMDHLSVEMSDVTVSYTIRPSQKQSINGGNLPVAGISRCWLKWLNWKLNLESSESQIKQVDNQNKLTWGLDTSP